MRLFADRGFEMVKMKVGGASPEEDLERVKAVRDRLGPRTGLILDAVSSLDADSALTFFDQVRGMGVTAFQARDFAEFANPSRVKATKSASSPYFRELIQATDSTFTGCKAKSRPVPSATKRFSLSLALGRSRRRAASDRDRFFDDKSCTWH